MAECFRVTLPVLTSNNEADQGNWIRTWLSRAPIKVPVPLIPIFNTAGEDWPVLPWLEQLHQQTKGWRQSPDKELR